MTPRAPDEHRRGEFACQPSQLCAWVTAGDEHVPIALHTGCPEHPDAVVPGGERFLSANAAKRRHVRVRNAPSNVEHQGPLERLRSDVDVHNPKAADVGEPAAGIDDGLRTVIEGERAEGDRSHEASVAAMPGVGHGE